MIPARFASQSSPQAAEILAAGRMCPLEYRYASSVFDRAPDISADALYVVGGLYGNLAALDAIEHLAACERAPVTIVFNGDFHWFDAEPDWFVEVERRVTPYVATRGNVETELARTTDVGAGCGCVYPSYIADEMVERSNAILTALRMAVPSMHAVKLRDLTMHLVAQVGPLRIGIVHGDATSLAGWRFDRVALDHPSARAGLNEIRADSRIDLFASSHTCAASLREFALPAGRLTIINNGAAGMPNFAGSRAGLISRIAVVPSPHRPVYGAVRDGVHIDAIPVAYDAEKFLDRFLARWREGSPAHASYFRRITTGPSDTVADARLQPSTNAA
jgi:hypothetical protein